MRFLVGAVDGYAAVPFLATIFVAFLRAARALPAGRGAGLAVPVPAREERAAA